MRCILAIVAALTARREERGRQSRGMEEERGRQSRGMEEELGNRRERERLGRGHCPLGRKRQSRGEGEERGRQRREKEERGRQRREEEEERGRQRREEEEERGRQRREGEERGNKRERKRREHCPVEETGYNSVSVLVTGTRISLPLTDTRETYVDNKLVVYYCSEVVHGRI